jgi:hypothetical protein
MFECKKCLGEVVPGENRENICSKCSERQIEPVCPYCGEYIIADKMVKNMNKWTISSCEKCGMNFWGISYVILNFDTIPYGDERK